MARFFRGMGWRPDLPDQRDHLYAAPPQLMLALPAAVDLRPSCPKTIYDQGYLGACTGYAIAGAIEFDELKQQFAGAFTPSQLFIYYNERVLEDTVDVDSGAYIRDGIKSIANQGAPPENLYTTDTSPYPGNTAFRTRPSDQAYQVASQHKAIAYKRVSRILSQMKGCLVEGYPFVFGFSVYSSFMSQQVATSGVVPMPAATESLEGGHAVLAVGYDDAQQRFIVRNSWGPGLGMSGYFTMPYQYLLDQNLSDDFWTVRLVQPAGN